jgi:hypothetical protein
MDEKIGEGEAAAKERIVSTLIRGTEHHDIISQFWGRKF